MEVYVLVDGGREYAVGTLYECTRALVRRASPDAMVVRDGRLVVFWDGHEKRPRPGCGAFGYERSQTVADFGER